MALCDMRFCIKCNNQTMHTNGRWNNCTVREQEEKERMWEVMDVSTKLTDLRKRIEKLEQKQYPMYFA